MACMRKVMAKAYMRFDGTCWQVPPAYLIQGRPLELEGEVVAGFGRGSSKMGVPTANIAPGPLAAKLEGLPLGVYFGYDVTALPRLTAD